MQTDVRGRHVSGAPAGALSILSLKPDVSHLAIFFWPLRDHYAIKIK